MMVCSSVLRARKGVLDKPLGWESPPLAVCIIGVRKRGLVKAQRTYAKMFAVVTPVSGITEIFLLFTYLYFLIFCNKHLF